MKKPEDTIVELTCPACGAHPRPNSEECWRCGERFEQDLVKKIKKKSSLVSIDIDPDQRYADWLRYIFPVFIVPLFFIGDLRFSLALFGFSFLVFFSQRRWYRYGGRTGIFSAVQVFIPFLLIVYLFEPVVPMREFVIVGALTAASAVVVLVCRARPRYMSFVLLGAFTALTSLVPQYRLIVVVLSGVIFGLLVWEFVEIDTYFVPAYLLPVPLLNIFMDSNSVLAAFLSSGVVISILILYRELNIRQIDPILIYRLGGLHEEEFTDEFRASAEEDVDSTLKVADSWLRRAKYQLSEGDLEEARESLQKALRQDVDPVEAHVMRYYLERDEKMLSWARRISLKHLKKYLTENLSYREKYSLLDLVSKAFEKEKVDRYFGNLVGRERKE
ncbi:MAG: tetratricopeptide repeat protein [Candidatus Thermoplasmatota archaeon]